MIRHDGRIVQGDRRGGNDKVVRPRADSLHGQGRPDAALARCTQEGGDQSERENPGANGSFTMAPR
jgi:hypothetical protein